MQRMIHFPFITTNWNKVERTNAHLKPLGISLDQQKADLLELQLKTGEEIARHKAQQAFEQLQTALLVNDDTWEIPALNNFPGPYMKQCNDHLTGADWIRLMHGVSDRTIIKTMFFVVVDSLGNQEVITDKHEYYILDEAKGKNEIGPHIEVVARHGSTLSLAEEIEQNIWIEQNDEMYQTIADAIKRVSQNNG